ncbi:MAG TPA: NAD-dependent epimerase/dehydratase family protein [Solirubrobacteraceae bacterium]|jgi:CDP-paratose 2-epimerase
MSTLITGGGGFIGTNLAERLLCEGERVIVLDDLSRAGAEDNLRWLCERHGSRVEVEIGDVRDRDALRRPVAAARRIFHFAAQVAVTTSLEEPLCDATVNALGTINLLEEARAAGRAPRLVFTSTNKVYGSLEDVRLREGPTRYEPQDATLRQRGIGEQRPLCFRTPYGCSKGAADQYVLDYAKSFGLPSVVFRMSCIYGPHQHGNEDQGWVAHFMIRALEDESITIFGDGKQVRDVLYVDDLVEALLLASRDAPRLAGTPFNIGGGAHNCLSLRELLALIGELEGREPAVACEDWRAGDQRYYASDTSAFARATGWSPQVAPRQGVRALRRWLTAERGRRTAAAA